MNNKVYHNFFTLATIPSLVKDVSFSSESDKSSISFVSDDKSVAAIVTINRSLLKVNANKLNVINVDKIERAFSNIKGDIELEYIVGELIVRSDTISYKHLLGLDNVIVATPKQEVMNVPACGTEISKEFVDIVRGICTSNKSYDCVTINRPKVFDGNIMLVFHNSQSEDLNYSVAMEAVSEDNGSFDDDLKLTIDLKTFKTIISKIKTGFLMLRSELLVEVLHEKTLSDDIEITAKYYITSK